MSSHAASSMTLFGFLQLSRLQLSASAKPTGLPHQRFSLGKVPVSLGGYGQIMSAYVLQKISEGLRTYRKVDTTSSCQRSWRQKKENYTIVPLLKHESSMLLARHNDHNWGWTTQCARPMQFQPSGEAESQSHTISLDSFGQLWANLGPWIPNKHHFWIYLCSMQGKECNDEMGGSWTKLPPLSGSFYPF